MIEKLNQLFEETARKGTGLLGIGFKDLTTGEELYYNGDKVFPLASVYKIFVLCELFRRQKEGTFSFAERHTLLESEKRIGSGILELIGEGAVLSMMDYTMLMMVISDNTSTSLLQQYTPAEDIRDHLIEPLGLRDTLFIPGAGLCDYYGVTVEEYKKITSTGGRFHARNGSYFRCAEPKNKQSSPRDMLKVLSMLQEGNLIDADSDRQILDIMQKCQTNDRIPKLLPAGVTVAHKTGSIDHLANDCGIVYTDCGAYVLTLFYNGNLASEEEYEGTEWTAVGNSLLSRLSRDIYDIFIEYHQK
ncbi:MAG: serine hydrolase [Clostridia bacterium]|nr:serine hydrolase [Clostridia bacterium]